MQDGRRGLHLIAICVLARKKLHAPVRGQPRRTQATRWAVRGWQRRCSRHPAEASSLRTSLPTPESISKLGLSTSRAAAALGACSLRPRQRAWAHSSPGARPTAVRAHAPARWHYAAGCGPCPAATASRGHLQGASSAWARACAVRAPFRTKVCPQPRLAPVGDVSPVRVRAPALGEDLLPRDIKP